MYYEMIDRVRGEVDDLYGNRIQKTKGPAQIFFCQAFASNFDTLKVTSYSPSSLRSRR